MRWPDAQGRGEHVRLDAHRVELGNDPSAQDVASRERAPSRLEDAQLDELSDVLDGRPGTGGNLLLGQAVGLSGACGSSVKKAGSATNRSWQACEQK